MRLLLFLFSLAFGASSTSTSLAGDPFDKITEHDPTAPFGTLPGYVEDPTVSTACTEDSGDTSPPPTAARSGTPPPTDPPATDDADDADDGDETHAATPLPTGDCLDYSLDLFHLQDASHSYRNDFAALMSQLDLVAPLISTYYPGSRLGIGAFIDKPIAPYGRDGDYCYELIQPLSRSNASRIYGLPTLARRGSGADWEEGQLDALFHVVKDREASGFLGEHIRTVDGDSRLLLKVVMMVTDSGYHKAGEGAGLYRNNGDDVLDCMYEDYVAVPQLSDLLRDELVVPLFMVTSDVAPMYRRLIAKLDAPALVVELKDDVSDILEKLERTLVALSERIGICGRFGGFGGTRRLTIERNGRILKEVPM